MSLDNFKKEFFDKLNHQFRGKDLSIEALTVFLKEQLENNLMSQELFLLLIEHTRDEYLEKRKNNSQSPETQKAKQKLKALVDNRLAQIEFQKFLQFKYENERRNAELLKTFVELELPALLDFEITPN